MNKEDCVVGQRVKIVPHYGLYQRFEGLIGTIKESPLGFLVVEIDIPMIASEIEPVEEVEPRKFDYPIGLPREFGGFKEVEG